MKPEEAREYLTEVFASMVEILKGFKERGESLSATEFAGLASVGVEATLGLVYLDRAEAEEKKSRCAKCGKPLQPYANVGLGPDGELYCLGTCYGSGPTAIFRG